MFISTDRISACSYEDTIHRHDADMYMGEKQKTAKRAWLRSRHLLRHSGRKQLLSGGRVSTGCRMKRAPAVRLVPRSHLADFPLICIVCGRKSELITMSAQCIRIQGCWIRIRSQGLIFWRHVFMQLAVFFPVHNSVHECDSQAALSFALSNWVHFLV